MKKFSCVCVLSEGFSVGFFVATEAGKIAEESLGVIGSTVGESLVGENVGNVVGIVGNVETVGKFEGFVGKTIGLVVEVGKNDKLNTGLIVSCVDFEKFVVGFIKK